MRQEKGRGRSQKNAGQMRGKVKAQKGARQTDKAKNHEKASRMKGQAKAQKSARQTDRAKNHEKASQMKGQAKAQQSVSQINKAKNREKVSQMKGQPETRKDTSQMKSGIDQGRGMWDTIIVGAGAAGMTAAITCGRQGQKVLLLDRQSQMGRKILVTGNGKCNLTNFAQKAEYYRSDCTERAQKVLDAFGQEEAMEFFQSLGIYTKDKNGYVYPYSEQAASVREAFEAEVLSNPDITFSPFSEVYDIQKGTECFEIKVKEKSEQEVKLQGGSEKLYRSHSVLITTGGLAGAKFGCDGSGYTFARIFGHRILKPLPALTALKSSAPFLKKVSGVRNQANITLEIDGQPVKREKGELQWTDYGISGVAIFQLSRFAIIALEEKKEVTLYFDFMPELSFREKKQLLLKLAQNHEKREIVSLVKGLFPVKLCPVILREAGLKEESLVGRMQDEEWENLVTAVSHFPLRINGYMGFEKAQVTRGGVSLAEVTDDLESNFQPGVFFAGEVTDVDGTCGGYNLQWAFSSGTVAGRAILKRNQNFLGI